MRFVPVLILLSACASGTSDDPGDHPDARVVVDPPDANELAIDAMPDPPDAMLDPPDAMMTTGGAVDTCAQGLDITAGASAAGGTTVTGDVTGYANDLEPASSCTGYDPDGPDAVYFVTATAGQTITAAVTASWDISIFVTQTCVMVPTCLIGADSSTGSPETESVTWPVTANGTYYVIVESWDAGAFGPYSLHVALQ
jgi:hypothetical protein